MAKSAKLGVEDTGVESVAETGDDVVKMISFRLPPRVEKRDQVFKG